MKIIMECEPDETGAVLKLIMDNREQFDRGPEKLGWGWVFHIPGGRPFFLRQIKGGISARPTR